MAIFIFTKKILEKRNITVYNKGLIKRDFTYIDDIVKGSLSAVKKIMIAKFLILVTIKM